MGTANRSTSRARELAAIHAAKRELDLDDESYRDMLWTVARVRSAGDLDAGGRRRVLDHLRERGWRSPTQRRRRPAPDRRPLAGKIRAQLDAAGRSDEYADAMARRMFGTERWIWLQPDQLRRLAAALYYDAQRHGRRTR